MGKRLAVLVGVIAFGATTVLAQDPRAASKPAAATGIRGRVTDAKTGEPLIACMVNVTSGGRGQAETDLEGRYTLVLPPGVYTLRVWYDQYVGVDVKNVRVRGDGGEGFVEQAIALAPAEGVFEEEVVVIGAIDRKSESGLLLERKLAATVQDSLGSEQVSRTPDSHAGDAVKRITSATVVGRQVFLRGLGGRYAATVVNGVALPSTDADGHQVPLDLFPSQLLSNLTVQKTYSAEMNGAFAGGVLGLETNSYPAAPQLSAKLSLGLNSETTSRPRRTYPGGRTDFLGVDDGTRALPDDVPVDQPLSSLDPDNERIAESFPNIWSSRTTPAFPSASLAISGGNTWKLPGGRALGLLASGSYARSEAIQRASVRSFRVADDGGLTPKDSYGSDRGTVGVAWGGLLNLGLVLSPASDISLLALLTRNADDTAQLLEGYDDTQLSDFDATRLQATSRLLSFNPLRGNTRFGPDDRLQLKWQANASFTRAAEPDTRDVLYLTRDGVRRFRQAANSGERFYASLADDGGGGSVTFRATGPIEWSVGASTQLSARRFDARRFGFVFTGEDPALLQLDPERLFWPEHLGPSVRAEERTFKTDRYVGNQLLVAGFAGLEATLVERLRAIIGARVELFRQRLSSDSPFSVGQTPAATDRRTVDPLPAVNVVYAVTDKANVRAGYSFTVARPQFREVAPFLYYDAIRRRSVSGNPDLVSSRIHNADLRWEWFVNDTELVSVGAFAKQFRAPIEQVVVSSIQGDIGFRNAESATSLGLELEGRLELSRLTSALAGLRLSTNVGLITSRVNLGAEQVLSTSENRPLQGQSPVVANIGLSYLAEALGLELALLYNVFGARISEVGFNRLPDTYEQPFHRVDASAIKALSPGLRLKLTGSNLLNQPSVFRQLDTEVYRFRPGVSASAQVEWSPL